MPNAYIEKIRQRRTIYALGKNLSQGDDHIIATIQAAVRESPSAFNSQSARVVILLGESHDKLWDIVRDELRGRVANEAAWEKTAAKVAGFKAAYGTVLFYEDEAVIEGLQEQMPTYAAKFAIWSEHGHGIAAHNVWAALANDGIGASLQHYNPIIDADVAKAFNIPPSWSLRAEMPFGSIESPAGEKEYMPDEERFRIHR